MAIIEYDSFCKLSAENFDAHTFETENPCLVFFGSERCHICKELAPMIEELTIEYRDQLTVYFVDIDKDNELGKRLRLRGIPQVLVFKQSDLKKRIAGLRKKEEMIEIIDGILHDEE